MASINREQIQKVATLIRQLPDNGCGLNFYSFGSGDKEVIAPHMYPPLNHPEAINFFFFVCLHQYGFWYGDVSGYVKPLIGSIGGKSAKGSDLLWEATKKAFDKDPLVFGSEYLADIEPEELFLGIFIDDNGPIPFPVLEERFQITKAYGQWFVKNKTSPTGIISEANKREDPLGYFLEQVQKIDGYNHDPLEKKNLLLAMAMVNRPENFLTAKDRYNYNWSPIIDYHLMRVALRLGLVDLVESEYTANKTRNWVRSGTEYSIRSAVFRAIKHIIHQSGQTMSFIDEKMRNARRYCGEMTEPSCPKCVFAEVCKKRIELFQPVFRTTAY